MVEIKIKKRYFTYNWKWDIAEEICGICQQNFEQMCSRCKHPLECKPCTGMCKHSFHIHCVNQWLQKNKICPMCRLPWSFEKIYE